MHLIVIANNGRVGSDGHPGNQDKESNQTAMVKRQHGAKGAL
jgi:hypothetical protein